jgi:hypothetical protein
MSNVIEFPKREPKKIGGNVLNTPYGDISPKDIPLEELADEERDIQARIAKRLFNETDEELTARLEAKEAEIESRGKDHKIGVSGRGRVTPDDFARGKNLLEGGEWDFSTKVCGSLNDPSPVISYEQGTIKYGVCFAPDKNRDALDAFRYALEKYKEQTGVMPQVIAGTPEAFRKLGMTAQGLGETINEAVAELKERLGGAVAEFTGKELTSETMKLIRERIDESFRDEFLRLQGYTLVGVDLASEYAKDFSGKVEIILDEHIFEPKIAYVGCSGTGGSSLVEAMRRAIQANEVCFPTVATPFEQLANELQHYELGDVPMNRAERRGHKNEKENFMRPDVCPRGGTKTVKKKQHRR